MQKLNLNTLEGMLKTHHKKLFTPQDVILLTQASKRATEAFLSYNAKRNRVKRLKNGLYALNNEYVSPYLIGNTLYQPSYISLETALSFYSVIPETVYSITSVTTKPTREFTTNGVHYVYHRVKQEAFTGYDVRDAEGEKIFFATPEKALADYCYFMYLGKKSWNDRTDLRHIDKRKLKAYIAGFNNKGLLRRTRRYILPL
jgi:predicted transcriptional regulator of viral defense system